MRQVLHSPPTQTNKVSTLTYRNALVKPEIVNKNKNITKTKDIKKINSQLKNKISPGKNPG